MVVRTHDIVRVDNYVTDGVVDGRRSTEAGIGAVGVFGRVVFTDSHRGTGGGEEGERGVAINLVGGCGIVDLQFVGVGSGKGTVGSR